MDRFERHESSSTRQPRDRRRVGMTILELLVSMTVLAIVIGWVMIAFTDQHHAQLNHERVIEAQHEGRLVTDLMVSDLRMAGFMVPTRAGVGSVDGGANLPDQICMSDPAVMDQTLVADANQRFSGAVPTGTVGAGVGSVTVLSADLDVDDDGSIDFAQNAGIIIADEDSAHCAVITSAVTPTTTTISFAPATPAGFNASGAGAVAVPAVHYVINGTDLFRNNTVLSSNVEDVQIEYWVDRDSDSVMDLAAVPPEFPVHDLNGESLSDLRLARVSVTSRTDVEDLDMPGQGFPAVANRVAGPADDFKRRRQIAETLLRNMR
jgi:type II secretory pathway pseudopilin PulG